MKGALSVSNVAPSSFVCCSLLLLVPVRQSDSLLPYILWLSCDLGDLEHISMAPPWSCA